MIRIFDCKQYTPEWWEARLGIPTASEFSAVLAKGEGKTRRKYMLQLIGERLTGVAADGFTSAHMERGHAMEQEARDMYSFDVADKIHTVGFVRRTFPFGDVGCSPDALIGEDGLLEIKTKLPHLQLEVLIAKKLPPEHVAQCQGALWVTGRDWLDFISYWPNLPLLIQRVYPDPEYFKKLDEGLAAFYKELNELAAQIPKAAVRTEKRPATVGPDEFTSITT